VTDVDESPFEGAGAPTRKVLAKPFGTNGRINPMMREEALRTLPRQECFDRGFIGVKDLDDEELVAGRCRDHTGKVPRTKGKTQLIPREQYDLMVAEHELRYKQKLRERLDSALDVMTGIMEDDTVEPRERFEAAKYIFERTAGKTPETVNVNVRQAPWEELLNQVTGIASMSREEHRALQSGIVDAEVVEETPVEEYWVEGDIKETNVHPGTDMQQERDLAGQRVDAPVEPELNYGRRADEKRSYVKQTHDAESLAKRRKEAKAKIQNAKKGRKIARALGADSIEDDITDVTMDEDGQLTFETE
jgi:hypothetical protein